jgi:hypothetical protein
VSSKPPLIMGVIQTEAGEASCNQPDHFITSWGWIVSLEVQ